MNNLILIIKKKQINENELVFRFWYYNVARGTSYKKKILPLKIAFPLINKNTLKIPYLYETSRGGRLLPFRPLFIIFNDMKYLF
jgi:hypothetical protein